MYLLLSILSYWLFAGKASEKSASKRIMQISFVGILFAGYFTIRELPLLFSEGFGAYALALPTCALGLIFYIAIFILAWRISKKVL
jgi:hypothetical protein